MLKQREYYLDNVKGFSMLLIIFGHCNIHNTYIYFYQWICTFHVPIFMIVSGIILAYKEINEETPSLKIRRKIYTYIVPYFFFSLLYCFFVKGINVINGTLTVAELLKYALKTLLSQDGCFTATWFLPCLFGAEIAFSVERRYLNNWQLIAVNVGLASVSVILPHDNLFIRGFLRIPVGLLFLTIGYFWYSVKRKKNTSRYLALPYICAGIVLHLILTNINGAVDMHALVTGKYVLVYFMNAVLASVCIISLFEKYLNHQVRGLSWFGRNTMATLCTHQLVIELLWIIDSRLFNLFGRGGIGSLILFCTVLLINIPITILLNRYAGGLIGRRAAV